MTLETILVAAGTSLVVAVTTVVLGAYVFFRRLQSVMSPTSIEEQFDEALGMMDNPYPEEDWDDD